MKTKLIIALLLLIGSWAFSGRNENSPNNSGFKKHIKFNHLYVVIDDSTYKYLFDSIKFFNDFAFTRESKVNTTSETWTGKYVYGKTNYLEIFRPNGYKDAKFGNVGFGFMPNKLGTLDSLYRVWKTAKDSVAVTNRDIVDENGKSNSWFRSISIPNKDSQQIESWLMENTKDHMLSLGFTENDLMGETSAWDYNKRLLARRRNIAIDSVKYPKLFDGVTSLELTVSNKELTCLRQHLLSFGFIENNRTFSKDDFVIKYTKSESKHFILNQIDFHLLRTLPRKKYSFGKIEFMVDGNKASMKLKYYQKT